MRSLLLLFTICITSLSLAQSISQQKLAQLHDTLTVLNAKQQFLGGVAIRQGDRVLFQKVYPDVVYWSSPFYNINTQFRIGSITKTFTATLIMLTVEEGMLTLDTRLSTFFPQFPAADTITIDHLLTHSSGLHNFTNDLLYLSYIDSAMTHEEMLAIMSKPALDFLPGEKHEYSNTNYVVLGYILELVHGKTYGQLLQERIAKPLQLFRTEYGDDIEPLSNEATSWIWKNDQWEVPGIPTTDMSIPHGAGGIVSTATDLTTFLRGLWQSDLVDSTSLALMITLDEGYGRGLFKYPYHDKVAWGHNGGIDAFMSHASYFPASDISIAVTLNGTQMPLNKLLLIILDTLFQNP